MSNSPADDDRFDTDRTDELPILLETAVLDADEHGVSVVVGEDETGEHTAHFAAHGGQEGASVDALRGDLEQRANKIVALEQDISRLSARWVDIERHLTGKDVLIDELRATLVSVRGALDSRDAAERRLVAEITGRDSQLATVGGRVEQLEREAAARAIELAEHQREREAAQAELVRVNDALAAREAATREPVDVQSLREEVATLSDYIANRRVWWDDLEARAVAQTARIAELEREVANRTERQQRADSLAEQAVARADSLHEQLVGQSRRAATLDAELSDLRGDPQAIRATIAALETQLASVKTAAATADALLAATREELADATRALAEQHVLQLHRDDEHAAALAAAAERRASELATAAETALAAAASATLPTAAALETVARLEAELERKRAELVAQRAELLEQSDRLAAAETKLEPTLRQLTETRAQLDQARSDAARMERSLVDKDRALDARDQRISTLQRELDQKLGALQKLNAMDLSLQGLDSKMSERLRPSDSAVDQPNTPALVCLTSDMPRQYALTKKTMTIGRSSRCDIQVLTHFVSREHARVTIARGTAVIEDLGSTNGIFVNAVRIDRQELRHGDLVTIGETRFRFLESMAH
jgi:chromosome segregation ATPase